LAVVCEARIEAPLASAAFPRHTQRVSGCPYTWVRNFLGAPPAGAREATQLRVTVRRGSEETVNVALPARSARWLMDLIPRDVVERIRSEQIPIEAIQGELARVEVLAPQPIFTLNDAQRSVAVWLE
jgi:hypothetical protein